jgi:hypothetical protein
MLIGGFVYLQPSPIFAMLLLVSFFMANSIGVFIWKRRGQLDPHLAIQVLLIVLLVITMVVFVSADLLGVLKDLDPRITNPKRVYLLLLLFPALMVFLYVQNRQEGSHAT